jgi:hypothetical protein
MSQRLITSLLAIGLVFLGGWLLAQPERPARDQGAPTAGNFAVAPSGNTAVLLETKSGKTWLLNQSTDGTHTVWLPAERIDRPDLAQQWLQREKELHARLAELEKRARLANEKQTRADLEELERQKGRILAEGAQEVPKK